MNGQMGPTSRPQMSQASMARHPSREQLIDYLMLKVSQPPPPAGAPRGPQDAAQQEVRAEQEKPCRCAAVLRQCLDAGVSAALFQIRVKVEKNPELGFSISGGVGGRGNPFRPEDNVKTPFVFKCSFS